VIDDKVTDVGWLGIIQQEIFDRVWFGDLSGMLTDAISFPWPSIDSISTTE
jgi:hypothetical protein